MVLRHFNLREQPFGVTPDPRYLFASDTHREALSSLLYGIESGLGFVTLTAKPGMGKTTLLFEVLRRLEKTAKTVFLFQSIETPIDLLRALLIDMGVAAVEGGLSQLQARLNDALVAHSVSGRRLIVVIDEAQHLDSSVLEAVRMLSNFETASHKLMQIVLSGQLELAKNLASPQLLQLRQRISIFAHLRPLSTSEIADYIQHRLSISGYCSDEPLFAPSAVALIARHSEGIPRNINNICFNALSLACALKLKSISANVVRDVVADLDVSRQFDTKVVKAEVELLPQRRSWLQRGMLVASPVMMAAGIAALTYGWSMSNQSRAKRVEVTTAPSSISVSPEAAPVSVLVETHAPETKENSSSITRVVQVRPGQSLYTICAKALGKCGPDALRELVRINPSIHDPNHIESGQNISIFNSL